MSFIGRRAVYLYRAKSGCVIRGSGRDGLMPGAFFCFVFFLFLLPGAACLSCCLPAGRALSPRRSASGSRGVLSYFYHRAPSISIASVYLYRGRYQSRYGDPLACNLGASFIIRPSYAKCGARLGLSKSFILLYICIYILAVCHFQTEGPS